MRTASNAASPSMRSSRTTKPRFIARVRSIELVRRVGGHLVDPDAPHLDVGLGVALALHLVAAQPPQHGELAGVRERIGNPALEHRPRLPGDRRARGGGIIPPPLGPRKRRALPAA